MLAECKHSLATNTFLTTVVVSLLIAKIVFRNSGYIILYPQPRCAMDRYSSFTGHHRT